MKASKIGDVNFGRYETEIQATIEVKKLLDREKISYANLIPAGWYLYDAELFPELDENGDGKPDDKFGYKFRLIYYLPENELEAKEVKNSAIMVSSIQVKGLSIKYVVAKQDAKK